MTKAPAQLHPALQYLKDHAVVIGLVLALAASVGFYAFNQMSANAEPVAATAVPTVNSTAGISNVAPTAAAGTPSAAATPTLGSTAPAGGQNAGTAAQGGSGPAIGAQAPAPTASAYPEPTVTIGNGPQAPTLQDWKITARGFGAAFANPSGGKDAWLAGIKPYVTPALYAKYLPTDIRSIPTEKLLDVYQDKRSGGVVVYHPSYASGSNQFQALMKIQPDGTWLVDQVDAPTK